MTEKITFRIPGKVQYSYTEFTGTAEELGRINYEMAAALFASALYSVGSAERAAFERLQEGQTALLPVSEVEGRGSDQEVAESLLQEHLGATEVGHKHHFEYDDDNKGHSGSFCQCGEEESPFPERNEGDYKPEPEVTAKKKPWETEKPKPATLNIDFDEF